MNASCEPVGGQRGLELVPGSADHGVDRTGCHLVAQDVEIPSAGRGEDNASSIRSPGRLNVHRGVGGQAPEPRAIGPNDGDVEIAVRINGERDPFTVRAPRRLEVIAGALGDGPGVLRADALNPDVAAHRIGQRRAVRMPARIERSAGDGREHVELDTGRKPIAWDLGSREGGEGDPCDTRERQEPTRHVSIRGLRTRI